MRPIKIVQCTRCGVNTESKSPYNRKYCPPCAKEVTLGRYRDWAKANPDKNKSRYKKYRETEKGRTAPARSKYNLSLSEYLELLADASCAVCETTDNLCIDHDHETGKVRGILCKRHNSAMGGLKDDISLLESAISYLERGYFVFSTE